jgi:phosphoglycolate phosphatase
MTETPPISLVCLDLAGIVIDDSVVERAYAEAIATQGIVPGTQDYARSMVRFDRSRGRPPAAVLRELFDTGQDNGELRAQVAALAFDRSFRAAAQRFGVCVPAVVADVIGKAVGSGAQVALVTVLSRSACEDLLGPLRVGNLVLCADDVPRSFPWPDPVLTAMLRLGIGDVHEVAVVSATEDGVLSGQRAGVGLVAGIGSGPRAADALREAGATHVLDTIAAFSDLLT